MPSNGSGSKRIRSPGYPAINLKAAIEKARDFHRAEGRNAAALPIAFQHWGYSKKSGSGLKALAALKSFGLVDVQGTGDARRVKLSDLGLRIILDDRENSLEREKAIADAALKPKIHKKLWGLWKAELPSHGNFRHHLIFEEKFNENFADDFIKEYVATIDYANVSELAGTPEEDEAIDFEEDTEEDIADEFFPPKLSKPSKLSPPGKSLGREIAKFPVGKNCTISLVADGEYTKKSIEALVAQLELNLELGIFDEIDSLGKYEESGD